MSSSTYNQSLWRRRENGLKRLGCWCAGKGNRLGSWCREERDRQYWGKDEGQARIHCGKDKGQGQDTLWEG